MSSKQTLIELDPASELQFIGPFTSVVSAELVLTNKSDERVLFKIKTTAPRRYCVRPNSGHITAGEKAIITIMLQPQDFDPQAERGKHKFMVQSCLAPPDFAGDAAIDQAWKDTPNDRIFDNRLKCVFVDEHELAATGRSNKSVSADRDTLDSQIDSRVGTAKLTASDSFKSADEAKIATGREDSQEQHLVAENERLRSQLNELQKQHAQLRQSELRLRNVAAQASVAQPTSTQTRAVVESRAGNSSLLLAVAVLMALLIGLLLGRFVV